MSSTEDLTSKYQRLGQEYQKARAQITVLKKGVVDEQTSNKVLQDALKQKDQTTRKYEQDIDSLQFRNSQLSKRVEILQNELDDYERKGTKPSKSNPQTSSISFIHQQELQLKIAENESLHKQLQEAQTDNQNTVNHLEARLEVLERNKDSYEKQIEDCNSKNAAIIERMKEEQIMLNAKVHKLEEDLKFAHIMSDKYQQQLKEAHQELRSKLDKTTKLMQEKVPFIDTENTMLNKLNIPVCDRNHQHTAQNFIESTCNQTIVLMAGLSDYHTYLEQRLKVYSLDIMHEKASASNTKFSSYLLQNATYSRKVQHTLTELLDEAKQEVFISLSTLPSYGSFVSDLKSYVKYLEKLLPYRVLSVNEECQSSMWSENLEKTNNNLLKEEKKIVSLFTRLVNYLSIISNLNLQESSFTKCVENIANILNVLSGCFHAIYELYVMKSKEEHNLPTYTDRLKTTDDCLLTTVHSLSSTATKLKSVFQQKVQFMTGFHGFKRKGLPSDDSQILTKPLKSFFTQAASYMQSISQESAPSSVPYSLAVRNSRSLIASSDNNDTLKEQAATTQEALIRLEQDKEHWMLEAQLVKAKFEKERKKTALLGEELKKCKTEALQIAIEENLSTINDIPDKPRNATRSTSSTTSSIQQDNASIHQVPLGTMEVFSKDKSGYMAESDHENLVKEHLTNRIAQLTKQLQITDSKCINFYHEAHSLYKQIVLADKNKQKLTNEIVDSNKRIETLQDELETTKRSYEEQLRTLTDHLCGMNEKLTSQKDEIDELKTGGGGSAKGSTLGGKFQLPGRKK